MTKENNNTGAAMVDDRIRKHPSYTKTVNYEASNNGERPTMNASQKKTTQAVAVYTQG